MEVHLRASAADTGVSGLRYEQLRTVYEETAADLRHERGGLKHAVWRFTSQAM
ncbi:hypothetical protein ACNPQM_39320 [Streptomyces sp. NPDC056231]|uniref:hypothetical protein n=1 Tax=Streptomyces sp. NPDC056231 TaxID=3345755 RepID=UPI003AAFE0AC